MTLHFRAGTAGAARPPVDADVVVACDGVNSAVRRQFYPDEELRFVGINTWRGVTRAKPFLTGRSYVRAGSMRSGNIVIYPIIDDVDGDGTPAHQLDDRGRAAGLRPERLEQAGPARGLPAASTRAGGSTGSTCPS